MNKIGDPKFLATSLNNSAIADGFKAIEQSWLENWFQNAIDFGLIPKKETEKKVLNNFKHSPIARKWRRLFEGFSSNGDVVFPLNYVVIAQPFDNNFWDKNKLKISITDIHDEEWVLYYSKYEKVCSGCFTLIDGRGVEIQKTNLLKVQFSLNNEETSYDAEGYTHAVWDLNYFV